MLVVCIVTLLLWQVRLTLTATCYVSPFGNPSITDCTNSGDPCRDFKFAIESATPNCTRIVAFSGLYTGSNNTGITATLPLVINGLGGEVVIDLRGNSRFLSVNQNSVDITNFTLVLTNLDIQNAFTTANFGGGAIAINIVDGGGLGAVPHAIFDNMRFYNNTASAGSPAGGALRVNNLPVIMRNSLFLDNSLHCSTAGGMVCMGGAAHFSRTDTSLADYVIEDTMFEGNSIVSTEDSVSNIVNGGALSIGGDLTVASTAMVRRTRFIDNSIRMLGVGNDETRGGAISAPAANLTVECNSTNSQLCTFSGNSVFSAATSGIRDLVVGGAISVITSATAPMDTAALILRNVVLFNNSVNCIDPVNCGVEYGGGAVASSRVFISGCKFCNNTAVDGAGADILILTSTDTEILDTGTQANTFTCNNTGAAIEPFSFTCKSPDCLYPSNPIVVPVSDICEPCLLAQVLTPTGNFFNLLSFPHLHILGGLLWNLAIRENG